MPSFVKSGQRYFAKNGTYSYEVWIFLSIVKANINHTCIYVSEHGAMPFEYCRKNLIS